MKIKINSAGFIEVERKDGFTTGECPQDYKNCGYWCIKAQEPQRMLHDDMWLIELCNGDRLYCNELEDLRNAS